MIERTTRTLRLEQKAGGTAEPFAAVTYNFPGACLLEVTYRIRPLSFQQAAEALEGIKLTFGLGNPPDFGLGNLQSETMRLPRQIAGLLAWETAEENTEHDLKTAETKKTNLEATLAQLKGQLTELRAAVITAEANYKAEPTLTLFQALQEAKGAIFAQEATVSTCESEISEASSAITDAVYALGKVRSEKPDGWTQPVTQSCSRTFNAVRIELQPGPAGETLTFDYEETLVAYRPQDLGTTPVTIGGG